MTDSISVVAWGYGGREEQEGEIIKGYEEIWVVILIAVMVPQAYTSIKTYIFYILNTCSLLHINKAVNF